MGLRTMLGLKKKANGRMYPPFVPAADPDERRKELIAQYAALHAKKDYGRSSEMQLGFVQISLADLGQPIGSVLDFGCGRSRLVDWVARLNGAKAYRYDPAIPEFSTIPVERADLVLNTDVLEHIPEHDVPDLLARMASISQRVFFNISIVEAKNILPNGENAHCTVRPGEWWQEQIGKHFDTVRSVKSYRPTTVSFVTWERLAQRS